MEIVKSWDGTSWRLGEIVADGLGHKGKIVALVSASQVRVEWQEVRATSGELLSNLRKLPEQLGGFHGDA